MQIKILSDQEAKKIAAGEVVERPASAVKELLENSIDAGSSKISLYIENAGKKLIRVVDDGCGMNPEDAKICFANHATSKISSLNDLADHHLFGFRGEALASISSVSKITLETRYNLDGEQRETGIKINFVDNKVVGEKPIACPIGTDISVHDLFYNTPVRQKFLKQDETEWNQIQNLFYAFCLSHISVHFVLHRDGRMILNAPPTTTLKSRVSQIWGHNLSENLIPLGSDDNITIDGLVSHHNFWRYGRTHIFFFVNGRWVKNKELSKGLMKGYKNVLPPMRFPAAFLFFNIDQESVDINVHPRKEEVRFAKPFTIEKALHSAVTKILEGFIRKQLGGDKTETNPVVAKEHYIQEASLDTPSVEAPMISEPQSSFPVYSSKPVTNVSFAKEVLPECFESVTDVEQKVSRDGTIIGQLFDTYIIIENDEELVIIDQHAAHERILYEKFLKNFEHKEGTRLMFPEIVRLSEAQQNIVLREKEFLKRQGIEIEKIGKDEIAIKTSPPKVQGNSLKDIIFEMIAFVEEKEHLDEEEFRKKLNEHVHSHLACKMAIKAGDKLSNEMMKNLVHDLGVVPNRFICVHGRPTTWRVSKNELEKKFRRR
jgi:DNA mismatch repair protein MutL